MIDEGKDGAENQRIGAESEGNGSRDEHGGDGERKKGGLWKMNLHK